MPRLRKYRVFLAFAFFLVFLLYRVPVDSAWDDAFHDQHDDAQSGTERKAASEVHLQKVLHDQQSSTESNPWGDDKVKIPNLRPVTEVKDGFALPIPTLEDQSSPAGSDNDALLQPPAPTRPPVVVIPDRRPGGVGDAYLGNVDDTLHLQKPPGEVEDTPIAATTTIHWSKPPEWFPVPEESLISLPTGKPKPVPRVQHSFGSEDTDTKTKRENRLAEVKAEMKHAWDGYAKFAFGHDEFKPISNGYQNPFAGWGATLVDALDSLWIMGFKDEFDKAYNGLRDIDFTTTPYRKEIPVFETTIRYLGGLLAAYDVTGGHKGNYPLLLNKAVELAEILMGIFDTPNRMPDLYYNWKPAYASQPKRASKHSGIAELGSLSMEFTRLAQLTGQDKYYDAVARITDALEEWQNRGDDTAPPIPGLFPQNVDASGCNGTATNALKAASAQAQEQAESAPRDEPQGYVSLGAHRSKQIKGRGVDDGPLSHEALSHETGQEAKRTPPSTSGRTPKFQDYDPTQPKSANGQVADWDCVAQNLTASAGAVTFSMGGSQDSAYEYFSKQYLLLGGLEPKYRTLHEKTVAAVKEWLLYRPMVPGDPDILFSANTRLSADQSLDELSYTYEVPHLTCFLGGMFGLGSRIFDSPEDLEFGRRLTDGCVWAYSAMPSGIMPEYAQVVPCPDAENCHWNETVWTDDYLDPDPAWRVRLLNKYLERLEEWEAEKNQVIRQEAERIQAAEELAQRKQGLGGSSLKMGQAAGQAATEPAVPSGYGGRDAGNDDLKSGGVAQSRSPNSKRGLVEDTADSLSLAEERSVGTSHSLSPSGLDEKAIQRKMRIIEAQLGLYDDSPSQSSSLAAIDETVEQLPIDPDAVKLPRRPTKPKTHEEAVEERITSEQLPPGFTQIGNRQYILRPEAIESVWYMYRITGDTTWQDKGWKMWKAIVKHTHTEYGNAAIDHVNDKDGLTTQQDKMESFWLAETLKYFYLLFAEPDVISLDDWVLNTEAHPFRRPM